jgi:hypothetical protein
MRDIVSFSPSTQPSEDCMQAMDIVLSQVVGPHSTLFCQAMSRDAAGPVPMPACKLGVATDHLAGPATDRADQSWSDSDAMPSLSETGILQHMSS